MQKRKAIFITGVASGIGRATALRFAREGWCVGGLDVNRQALEALAGLPEMGGSRFFSADVTAAGEVASALGDFHKQAGERLDVLFNSAGILHMGLFARVDLARQQRTVAVNLIGLINAIHAAVPFLKATAGARVINMSSASAVYGVPELAVYSATKCAVRGLTEALNIELEPQGIWVCDVMAPYIRTPMILDAARQATSVRRLGVRLSPEAVVEVVWRASRQRRLHWTVGRLLPFMMALSWALPWIRRPLTRRLSFGGLDGGA